jgi:hypothetical protein
MKNIFLLLLGFCTLSSSAQSFDYFAHNPRWVEGYYFETDPRKEIELYTQGDSLHNGVLYHKLWISDRIPDGVSDRRTDFPRIHGLIRQDGYKVWYKGFLTKKEASYYQSVPLTDADTFPDEFLLFDFGMEVGDTLFAKDLPTIGPEYDEEYFVLGYIDSVEEFRALPNTHARLMFFGSENNNSNIYLENHYEGIGSENSFLGSPIEGNETGVGDFHTLDCYNNDSTEFIGIRYRYGPSQRNCGASAESVHEKEMSTNSIYPKPSTGTLYFKDNLPIQVKVFNALGQVVLSETNQSGIQSITLNGKPAGLYNVQYQTQGKLFVEKIVLE